MKSSTKLMMAALALLAGLLGSSASAQNLLLNGNFEATDPFDPIPGWVSTFNGPDQPSQNQNLSVLDASDPAAHVLSGKSLQNFFDGNLKQEVSGITPGQQYTLSGSTFVEGAGTSASGWSTVVKLTWLDSALTPLTTGGITINAHLFTRDQWNSFDQVLTAPSTAAFARVELGQFVSNSATITPSSPSAFDVFALQLGAIPEPSTYGMLALGLGVLIPVVRRRMKRS